MSEVEASKLSNEELAQIIEACCRGYWLSAGKEAARRLRNLDEINRGGMR